MATELQQFAYRLTKVETEMSQLVDSIKDWRADDARCWQTVTEALGQSPDKATGRPGTGMRGQLASLVNDRDDDNECQASLASNRAKWMGYAKTFSAVAGGSVATIGFLKAMNII